MNIPARAHMAQTIGHFSRTTTIFKTVKNRLEAHRKSVQVHFFHSPVEFIIIIKFQAIREICRQRPLAVGGADERSLSLGRTPCLPRCRHKHDPISSEDKKEGKGGEGISGRWVGERKGEWEEKGESSAKLLCSKTVE